MKHRTLRIAATLLAILAWIMGAAGVVVSVLVGIDAATVLAKIGFVLGGFIISAFSVIMLLAVSRLIYLFIEIEDDLSRIAGTPGTDRGD